MLPWALVLLSVFVSLLCFLKISKSENKFTGCGLLTVVTCVKGIGGVDSRGKQYVTLVGIITGVGISPVEIVDRFVVDEQFCLPKVGDEFKVVFNPNAVKTSWKII